MTATVKAVRSENGHQLDVRARVLLCWRVHHQAAPANVRLIVDTGSAKTHLRVQALSGVEFRRTEWVCGIAGGKIPGMETQAHLVFDGQLITAPVVLLNGRDRQEDGVIGLDLLQSMGLRDGQAELQLAVPDDRYRSALDEVVMAKDCGCWPLLRQAVKDRGIWHRTGF